MENKTEITATPSFSFKKEERLSSKKVIDRLFVEGESFLIYPLKVVFLRTDLLCNFPAQAGFSVSKKNFKRAVHRNRIKRLMRESYRLKKHILYSQQTNGQLAVFFIYVGKEILSYKKVESAVVKAIQQLGKRSQKS